MDNRLRRYLADGQFAVTVEIVPPGRRQPLAEALGACLALARAIARDPRVAGLTVADRVRSDDDADPVAAAVALAEASGETPLVHLSGKDRTLEDLARSLARMAEAGIDNVLCVTGDRLKAPPVDRRVRYVDSVDAVRVARRLLPSSALVAAGVSPFKYTEEETFNQYFKMAVKHAAGADCLITQVGWDMAKLAELMRYRRERGFDRPVMAAVMVLSPGMARNIHKGSLPGVVVTDDLLALIETEAQAADKGRAARLTRFALQIVGTEHLGYAGVHLSAVAGYEDLCRILDLADEWRQRVPTPAAWWDAWNERLRLPDGTTARVARDPGFAVFDNCGAASRAPAPLAAQRGRYALLHAIHQVVFQRRSPVYHALAPLVRRITPDSGLARTLAALERRIKAPFVGCELCGYCRLPETFYICPETCPKGLANGPCGGSTGNVCEAGDRECIHALEYRIAKAAGRLHDLECRLIAPVPEPRGGSSWIRHFTESSRSQP